MIANCPTDEQLLDFSLGRLAEQQSDELFNHVTDCDRCQEVLVEHDASGDTLVDHLQQSAATERDNYVAEDGCRSAMARALAVLATTNSDEQIPDDLPDQIGDYKILRLIGRGGMGNVYLAQHTRLGRRVALKVIAGHRAADPKMQGRFETEMQAVGQLSHHNIVAALDAREVDGLAVLITEWIDGLDLGEVIRRTGPLSVADACRVTEAVVDALAAIHEAGLVHRDIKPSNIMLDRQGNVKLLDLGLARFQDESATRRELTATGQTIGTADYLAPEQINATSDVDGRTDVYALGCTLFKLLTGLAPFGNSQWPTAFDKMNAHVSENPPVLDKSQYPADLVQLVGNMLAKQPGQRTDLAQAGKVVRRHGTSADLESVIQKAWTAKPQEQPANSGKQTEAQTRPWYRRPVPLAVAVAAGLSGILLGYLLGVIITIKKPDGTTATLEVPDGSHVKIDEEGNAIVEPGGTGNTQAGKDPSSEVPTGRIDDTERIRGIWHAIDQGGWGYVAISENHIGIFSATEPEQATYELDLNRRSLRMTFPFRDEEPGMVMDTDYNFVNDSFLVLTVRDPNSSATETVRLIKLDRAVLASTAAGSNTALKNALRTLEVWDSGETDLRSFIFPARQLNGAWALSVVWQTADNVLMPAQYQLVMDRTQFVVLDGDQVVADGVVNLRQGVDGLHGSFMFIPPQTELPFRLLRTFKVDWSRGGLVRNTDEADEESSLSADDLKQWPREISGLISFVPLNSHSDMIEIHFHPDGNQQYRNQQEMQAYPRLTQMKLEELPLPRNPVHLLASLTNPENDERAMAAAVLFQMKSKYMEFSDEELHSIQRWQSMFRLRQLVYAAHIFHDANRRLPKSEERQVSYQNVQDEDGIRRVPVENLNTYSWRVALLPHLGYQELYDQYRFDEPWDSPNNSLLLRQMPEVFRHPADSPESNETRYVGFAGEAGALGQSLEQINDGTSNTLLFVESSTPVLWTQPQDIDFDADDDLQPKLEWFLQDECNVALCDASVRTIKTGSGSDRTTIRHLITPSGGEFVDVDRNSIFEQR
ncbi:MAG: protein kinase domain-containing protein [Pirellulaceae bacterium]